MTICAGDGATPVTVTLVTAVAEPLGPVHVSVYCGLPAAVGFTNQLPVVAYEPLQAPLALQDVALKLDQCRAVDFPSAIVFGQALRLTVGTAEPPDAVTLARAVAEPPAPVQVNLYCDVPDAVGVTYQFPVTAKEPLQAPLAVQLVALVLDQCSAVD
jgi:hypothetical protein